VISIARKITTQEIVSLGGRGASLEMKLDHDWPAYTIHAQADDLDGLERVLWALETQVNDMLRAIRHDRREAQR